MKQELPQDKNITRDTHTKPSECSLHKSASDCWDGSHLHKNCDLITQNISGWRYPDDFDEKHANGSKEAEEYDETKCPIYLPDIRFPLFRKTNNRRNKQKRTDMRRRKQNKTKIINYHSFFDINMYICLRWIFRERIRGIIFRFISFKIKYFSSPSIRKSDHLLNSSLLITIADGSWLQAAALSMALRKLGIHRMARGRHGSVYVTWFGGW